MFSQGALDEAIRRFPFLLRCFRAGLSPIPMKKFAEMVLMEYRRIVK